MNKIEISFVPYVNGEWDFIIRDVESGDEVLISSKTKTFTEKELELLYKVAPMCVYSNYQEVKAFEKINPVKEIKENSLEQLPNIGF